MFISTSSHNHLNQPSLRIVSTAGQAAADHDDAHRFIELHRQTEHKLEMQRRYPAVFAAITAKGFSKHVFLNDTHGGGGIHASIENIWTYGTPMRSCFAARDIQRRFKGVQVHVRAIEKDPAAARLLRECVQRFIDASGPDRVDVQVIEGDYAEHLPRLVREVQTFHAASLWLIDPKGIDIPRTTLEPLMKNVWGLEVIINLDASGALRAVELMKSKAMLNDVADLQSLLYDKGLHQSAVGELFDTHTWRESLIKGGSWNANLDSFAKGYANIFVPAFRYAMPYRLRSSDNQVRYLVHLTRHPKGLEKFAEAFEASGREGLLAVGHLDGPGLSASAAHLWALYKGTETTLDRLEEEYGNRYTRRDLREICAAADRDLYGVVDPVAETITWLPKRGKPTQTVLFPQFEGE